MSAEFLRELAEVIDEDGDCRRLDGEDVTKLKAAADHVEALERDVHRRANAQLELVIDKERLIYHVLSLLTAPPDEDRAPRERAHTCLEHFGYWSDSDRARRMLELGEPGRRSNPTVAQPFSELEQRVAAELNEQLSRHVGEQPAESRSAILASALAVIMELTEGLEFLTPQFELTQDPTDPSRITIVRKGRP